MQTTTPAPSTIKKDVLSSDLLRALFFTRISKALMEYTIGEDFSPEMQSATDQAIRAMGRFEKTVFREPAIKHNAKWLAKELEKDKMLDIAVITEMLARIGVEEKDSIYEEFQSMVISQIDSVFYAEKHRKNIYFSKYKALFKLISDELRRDVNKEPSVVRWHNGELFLQVSSATLPQIQANV
jgi:hypothetical protein